MSDYPNSGSLFEAETPKKTETHPDREGSAASNVRSITRESIGPGTVVKLKSGGPHMTVIERSTNWAYVTWHKDDGNDVLKDWLPTSCLEVVK